MTDKITIERQTLEQVLECLVQEGRSLRAAEVREALEQKEEPPAPSQGKSLALLDLDSVEHMQGGANGRGRLELPTNGLKAPWGTECGGAV